MSVHESSCAEISPVVDIHSASMQAVPALTEAISTLPDFLASPGSYRGSSRRLIGSIVPPACIFVTYNVIADTTPVEDAGLSKPDPGKGAFACTSPLPLQV